MDIKEIVAAALDELSWGDHEYARMKRLMFRGIRKMRWDFIGKIRTVKIKVLPNKTAMLPAEFLKERKVGLLNSDGEIATFVENPNLAIVDCGIDRDTEDNDRSDDRFEEIDGGDHAPVMGSGRWGSQHSLGEYRINRDSRMIVFNPGFPHSHFYLEFNSATDSKGNCDVPEMVSEALIAWGVMKSTENRSDTPAYLNSQRKAAYEKEMRLARLRIRSLTKSRKNQSSRQAVRQTVKG